MKRLIAASLIGIVGILVEIQPSYSQTSVIRGASSVTTDLGTTFGSINTIINQSGLDQAYTNGEEVKSYLAKDPKHSFIFNNEWFSDNNRITGNVDFNLGGLFNVSSFILWNEESRGINEFKIITSTSSDFSNSVDKGSFTGVDNTNLANYSAQQYEFSSSSAQFIRLQILSAFNDLATPLNNVGIGEVAFGVESNGVEITPIPFEFSPALGIATLGVVFFTKKVLKSKTKN
jgi:hypothetical protein